MKAVIMAGGLGTRLRPLTCNVPKPMVPVLNRPILEHTILLLKKHGITEIVLLLFYLPHVIKKHFGDGSRFGVELEYITPDSDYGTAGAAKQAMEWIQETCLIVSGDAITDLDLTQFIGFHRKKKAGLTMALALVGNPSPFGIAITNKQGRVTRFLEKPSWGQVFSDTVNMGIYVLEPGILDFIPKDSEYYFAKDLFPVLLREKQPVYGFNSDCYWKDIGNLKTYQQVHWDWFDNKIELDITGDPREGIWLGENCKISALAKLEAPLVLGDHCVVEEGARVGRSIIGNSCTIGRKASVANSILWNGVAVAKGAELNFDVVASQCEIGEGAYLNENVFISHRVAVGANSQINANVKIWPQKEVDAGAVVNASMVWGDKWQREHFTDSRVTGLANLEINPEFGAKLGAAFGTWLGKDSLVAVSRDPTSAARMIDRSMICGLMSAGVDVHDLRVIPIPIVRYAIRSGNYKGGIHVRRSPFQSNLLDILFFDKNGRDLAPNTTKTLERLFFREDFPRVSFDEVGDIDFPVRISEAYVQDCLDHIDIAAVEGAKFKVVIDYSFGAATQVFPAILGSLDCEVITLNAFLHPEKMSRTAKKFEDALQRLAKIVRSTQAHAGFLIDSGAEKIFCVDEKGRILKSERLVVLVTKLLLTTQKPRKIAVPVSIPSQVEAMAQRANVELVYTAEDGGSIIQATEDPAVEYAAGTKGGFIFTDFHFAFDGLFALVKILELMAKSGQTLGQLNDETPKRIFKVESVPCPWEAKGQVMRKMAEYSEDKRRLLVDGVKIIYDDAWVLVVPDRDKASCHVVVEAPGPKSAEKLVTRFRKIVQGSAVVRGQA
ncbi:MAG: sugar phosphate nucleotidyltransferase [bacterium]